MELNKEKKMKSEQAVLPNPCLEEGEEECHSDLSASVLHVLELYIFKRFISYPYIPVLS
jgi:hypothetical protein